MCTMHGCTQCSQWGYRPLSPQQLQYAAIDARASLLLYNKLQPEVPAKHFNSIKRTYKYIGGPGKGEMLTAKSAISAKAVARKAAIPRAEITVSKYEVDVDGLRQRWLGKPLPDVRKEGVVRACLDPQYAVFAQDDSISSSSSSSGGEAFDGSETSSRSSSDPTLGSKSKAATAAFFKYDRHQSFIEFKTAVALLMNFGKGDNTVLHAGDSDSYTTSNGYHTTANGDRSSSTDAAAASRQQQQQQQQQQSEKRVVWSMQGRTASKDDDDVIRFLEKVSSTTDTLLPLGQLHTTSIADSAATAAVSTAETASATSFLQGHKPDSSSADPHPLRLVLFCRAPGQNFVYCGEVTCYHHEYVWRDGEEVGSIRLSLALQDWPQLAEKLQQQSSSDSGVLPYFQNRL
jgi:3'-5' exonuclease